MNLLKTHVNDLINDIVDFLTMGDFRQRYDINSIKFDYYGQNRCFILIICQQSVIADIKE